MLNFVSETVSQGTQLAAAQKETSQNVLLKKLYYFSPFPETLKYFRELSGPHEAEFRHLDFRAQERGFYRRQS